jgi:chemotaxis protein methyltransferase CheR
VPVRQEHSGAVTQPEISDSAFAVLHERLLRERSLNLGGYKDRCIRRRIAVRLRARRCSTLQEYLDILNANPQEMDKLVQAITINVSGFFRNRDTFDLIRNQVIPSILNWRAGRGQKDLKIWSAGCATGEEVYSLAIILRHYFKGPINSMHLSITGTDLNQSFLEHARKGIYSRERLEDVPEEIITRFFRNKDGNMELVPRIQNMVTFEKRDILEPFPFKDLDMILCRNVLIYLSRDIQERIFDRFYQTLRPEGFLVLGKTETLLEPAKYGFKSIIPRERVYQKKALT